MVIAFFIAIYYLVNMKLINEKTIFLGFFLYQGYCWFNYKGKKLLNILFLLSCNII